jgi:hypothetical protein
MSAKRGNHLPERSNFTRFLPELPGLLHVTNLATILATKAKYETITLQVSKAYGKSALIR